MGIFEKKKFIVASISKNQIWFKCSKCRQKQIVLYKQAYGRRIHHCIKCGCKYSIMLGTHNIERISE